ncbi:MAG: hypothetical protein Q8K55_01840 [Gemmatimonadaceae bacterium]|nr:hypothetical protein [Gemmatimonadaceae bacterium]
MRPLSFILLAGILAVSMPSSAAAQGHTAMRAAAAPPAAVSGAPVASQASIGVQRLQPAPAPLGKPAPFRGDTRQNRALMIVGGAGMLTGMVIGGDSGTLITVGGGVVFLWGLYQYLQ